MFGCHDVSEGPRVSLFVRETHLDRRLVGYMGHLGRVRTWDIMVGHCEAILQPIEPVMFSLKYLFDL